MSLDFIKKWFHDSGREVVFEGDSEYGPISIIEENGCRTMYLGPLGDEAETSIALKNPEEPVFEYPGLMLSSLIFKPQGGRIVMVGLGGGYLPNLFQKYLPQFELTVVEINPLVAELAEIYFGFSPGGNVRLVVMDGREYIEELPEEACDYIWLDAFDGDYIPQKLMSREFLRICQSRLADGGFLVQNLHRSRPHLFNRQIRTIYNVLGEPITLAGNRSGNVAVINPKIPQSWPQSHLKRLAKGLAKVGPYHLANELNKRSPFRLEPSAKIIIEQES